MVGIAIMARYVGNSQKVWIEGTQTRVDVTATMLSSMEVRRRDSISPGIASEAERVQRAVSREELCIVEGLHKTRK